MAMITEDYVSFEIAKLLKEKGFDEPTIGTYNIESKNPILVERPIRAIHCEAIISAPTLQMVMKWLREVYHWHIFVFPRWEDVEYMPGEWEEKMVGYQYTIINVGEFNVKDEQPITTALSSESACEAAIKYCLEHLI